MDAKTPAATTPDAEHPDAKATVASSPWTAVVLITAALLVVFGGGVGTFRGPEAIELDEIRLPETIEPEGDVPTPPTAFRWTPGVEDALAQVMIYKPNFEILWTSAPLEGKSELAVPLEIYEGQAAGSPLYWRVREVIRGHALGSSEYEMFSFRIDAQGYGPGQAPAISDFVE
ncbi:MAG: hypothetical protein ACT4PE_02525 [Candidatus Eiseniibacteriota bacterium]